VEIEIDVPGLPFKIVITEERGVNVLSISLFDSIIARAEIDELTEPGVREALVTAAKEAEIPIERLTPDVIAVIHSSIVQKQKSDGSDHAFDTPLGTPSRKAPSIDEIDSMIRRAKEKSDRVSSLCKAVSDRLDRISKELE